MFPYRHVPALSVVIDLDVVVLLVLARGRLGIAQATLTVDLAIRVPGLIAVGAHATTQILLLGALRDADALGLSALGLADLASAATDLGAGV